MDYFANSQHHLLAELERIDLLIRSLVASSRRAFSDDEQFRGLYISEQELEALLKRPIGRPSWTVSGEDAGQNPDSELKHISAEIQRKKQHSLDRGIALRLETLRRSFGLTQFDIDTLLICIAVELDLRYERLYAYLHDDVTKRKPSVDLVLNVLVPTLDEKLALRQRFSVDAPLIRHHVVDFVEDPSMPNPPLLATYLKADPRIVGFLLGFDDIDDRIRDTTTLIEAEESSDGRWLNKEMMFRLRGLRDRDMAQGQLVIHLRGPYGIGKQSTAAAICAEKGLKLLVVDLSRLSSDRLVSLDTAVRLIIREAQLHHAALYWQGFDMLFEDKNKQLFETFTRHLECSPSLIFLAGKRLWEPRGPLRGLSFTRLDLAGPSAEERVKAWGAELNDKHDLEPNIDIAEIASKFKFTAGQIRDAVATATNLATWRGAESSPISKNDLYEAARRHSNQTLSTLARKVTPTYQWDDIVLPVDRVEQLGEICNYVTYRGRVYGEWGFGGKLALGKGLSVLFAGPSGTGKTMAADIIAGELGLDLYKIDLSTVVSKYIGETEKNLSQIFTEAETSNSILFFDEADALFGKRSEVKDAHDRYANIETGYLLQRMEEYEGVVILATNFRKNMDEAFVRRLHFTVEFPFPKENDRRRIWEGIWPAATPRDPMLDLEFMARRFDVTGGNIRNIALAAAFLAADNGSLVDMTHLIRATQREYQKMGKIITEGDFGHYGSAETTQ